MDRTVTFVLGMLTAGIIGVPIGIWAGGEMEQDAFIDVIQGANLSDQCLAEFTQGVDQMLSE